MKSRKFLFALVLAAAPSNVAFGTYADSVVINQIAVTGTPALGAGGTFTSFSAPTTDRDVNRSTGLDPFWFIATTSNGNTGVFVYDALYHEFADLVDTTTTAPTGELFASFSNLTSGEGVVGFLSTDSNGSSGIYGIGDIPLTLIASPSTVTTSGITLGNVQNISITGDYYGNPAGLIQSAAGIDSFIYPGSPHLINYASFTSISAASYKGSFGNSNEPGIQQEVSAILAIVNNVNGIYYGGPGATTNWLSLANVGDSTPNGTGTFTSFGNPYATANEVAFTAHYTTTGSDDQQGIFIYGGYIDGGDPAFPPVALKQIVATGQVAPNSHNATFTGFSSISDTSYDTTFLASLSDGNEGLYINYTGNPGYLSLPEIVKVIETGDTLSGRIVDGISLAPDASNFFDQTGDGYTNTGIGFEVNFTDGSEGIYYFTVSLPEPAVGLCGLATLLITHRRSRPSILS